MPPEGSAEDPVPFQGQKVQQDPAGFREDLGTEVLPIPAPWLQSHTGFITRY